MLVVHVKTNVKTLEYVKSLWPVQLQQLFLSLRFWRAQIKQTVPLGGVSSMLLISQNPAGKMEGEVPW